MKSWRRLSLALFVAMGLQAPVRAAEFGPPPPPLPPESIEARIENALALPALAAAENASPADLDDIAGARAFYAGRRFVPLWLNGAGLDVRAEHVVAEIGRAGDWGLKAGDFTLPKLAPGTIAPSNDAAAAAEVTLTRAVLKYGRHARGGRIADPAAELSSYLDRKPPLLAPQAILEGIAAAPAADAYLRGLNPRHAGFERLRRAYLEARAEQGRFAGLMLPPGPALLPGQSHPSVAVLRRRMAVPVSLAKRGLANLAEYYDPQLVSAVAAFQSKSGLRPDGIVGDKTRAALNVEGGGQLSVLLANMEVWRWMPEQLGETHILVNIPEFQMRLVSGGTVVHAERVVTGKPDTSTPVFSEMMQTVVFQPKWGVPESIKINELLPRLERGGGLRTGLKMSLDGREVDPYAIDWSRADIRRYHIYQPSGDDNALGVVKFLFPNKHAVYLHDTPSKGLFNAGMRAFSHGCIRVRNPVRLAELVLGADKGWSAERVRELVEDGPEDNAVKLDTMIPVHVVYFTAVADEDGRVTTFPDVYGHAKRITQALEGRRDLIARLDPPPLGSARGTTVAGDDAAWRRRSAEAGLPPASALGLAPPKVAEFTFFAPAPKASGGGGGGSRFRGSSTNDLIMRQLGGF